MRGQAFETMMLVISVIVALAILAVLLNLINLSTIFTGVTSDPAGVMNKGLRDVVSRGYFVSQPQKVVFEQSTILRGTVRGDIPDIRNDEVSFFCRGDECGSGGDKAINDPSNEKLDIFKKVTMNVVVCGDVNKADKPKYCIGVSRVGKDASDACIEGCNLQ